MPKTAPTNKKATNITLSSDELAEAKSLGINISKVSDQFLRDLVCQQRKQQWQSYNAEFIAVYNHIVEQEELPLQRWRMF